jgi:uncharacterized protein (DUF1800 family)
MTPRAAIAAVRFGLGRRPEDPVPADPAAWLERQVAGPPAPQRQIPGLAPPMTLADAMRAREAASMRNRVDRDAVRDAVRMIRNDAVAWVAHCLAGDASYQDRLTNFWCNHFAVSPRARAGQLMAGPMLRDAVRANQAGRFADMLLAVVRHPAMGMYLTNIRSTGPNSAGGMASGRGLNENLAREVLELHTVTPAAGYTQADVTELARVLTGWSLPDETGATFQPRRHEPGPKTVMGRTWPEGEQAGIDLLRWLAGHPATHRNLASKLVRHFVADDPPPAAVEAIFAVLRDTGGDLGAASRALVRLPQAWDPPLSKLRAPQDYVLAVGRAVEHPPADAARALESMEVLGQPLWRPGQPDGFPDVAEPWATPAAVLRRVEWAYTVAAQVPLRRDPRALAEAVLGPLAQPDTLREAGRAGSAREALTIILASPEFQRR